MKIEKIIKEKLKEVSKNKILNELNYSSNKKALDAFNKFINSKNLHQWLHSGFYDFKYNSLTFFKKICEILNIEEKIIDKTLLKDKEYYKELEKFKNSYIFIYTNFKRKNEPIFVLGALESQRRINIPIKKLLFKKDKKILKIIGKIILKNYKITNGNTGIWGKAINYIFYFNNKKYIFDINGERINNIIINENKVILKLK